MKKNDPYGTPHPAYNPNRPRFMVYVDRYDADDEPEWQYKLRFVDNKYQDSDGYLIDAIAAGTSWENAFAKAGEWVTQALATDRCIF